MNKKFKLIASIAPIIGVSSIVASCKNDSKTLNNAEKRNQLAKEVDSLTTPQKVTLISKLKLSNTDKAKLIAQLNDGAHIAGAILFYVKSAEQRAAALQAYTLAKAAFDNLKKKADNDNMDYNKVDKTSGKVSNPDNGKAIPVVFMDIDETVLVNEYTQASNVIINNGKYSRDFKENIDQKGNRKAVPGAVDFINHVFENGGIVLFNSNIRQLKTSVDGIKKNLIKVGVKEQFVHDWMFWTRGVVPMKDDKTYDPTPWKTALELGVDKLPSGSKAPSKNARMNAVSDNPNGWNFSVSQKESGDKIVTKVIMKIGDDFNDFFDDAYKNAKSGENIKFAEKKEINDLFTKIDGAKGVKVTGTATHDSTANVKIEELSWHQFNVQVPGNAMYGGWAHDYESFEDVWKALEEVRNNSQDNK